MKKLTTLALLILACHCYAGLFSPSYFYCIDGYRYVYAGFHDSTFIQMFQLSPDKQSSVPVQCKPDDEVFGGE